MVSSMFVRLSDLSVSVTLTGRRKAGPSSKASASPKRISAGVPSENTSTPMVMGELNAELPFTVTNDSMLTTKLPS